MTLPDWIFLGCIILVAVFGGIVGLGKGLKALTSGKIKGTIISAVLCYLFGGMILQIPFVGRLLQDFAALWSGSLFSWVHFEVILYYILLFGVFCLLRILVVFVLQNILEMDVLVMRIINKVGGVILFAAVGILLMLFIFQIISWIGGNTAADFATKLAGSVIVKPMFVNNPLDGIVNVVKGIR